MFRTLRTLMRAGAAEAEEGLQAAEGPRLLAQHLRDAEVDLKRARHGLASLIARERAEARRREEAAAEIARREGEARDALARGEETLAEDLAERIADLEEEINRCRKAEADLARRIAELRRLTTEGERRMTRLAADLRAARAGRLARGLGRDLAESAMPEPAALERAEALAKALNDSGRAADDVTEALRQHPGSTAEDLDARLGEAGIATDRQSRRAAVLARLKTQSPDDRSTDSKGDA
ncbi:MAG: PspA/IM30 family protein [Pseudomonadota bacterium]